MPKASRTAIINATATKIYPLPFIASSPAELELPLHSLRIYFTLFVVLLNLYHEVFF